MEEDFRNKNDEELVTIIAVPPNNKAHQAAAAELHRRQKQERNKDITIQKWILRLTIAILILTVFSVVVMLFK